MKYQLIERNAFQIIGVMKLIDCTDFNQSIEISRYWAQLGQEGMLDQLIHLNTGEISGLIGATVNYHKEKNQIEYWVSTESSGDTPEGLFRFDVPAAKWAIFEAIGPVKDVVPETWKKIYADWFPSKDYEHSGAPSLEVYKSPDPTSPTASTEIWVPIK